MKNMKGLLQACTLCPRKCGVNRSAGVKGRCRTADSLYVARAALHPWEEPCISGTAGSGTVFFSGCPLGCIYCQNHTISAAQAGKEITIDRLCDIFLELEEQGAANINLVTPTHYVPHIIQALELSKSKGLQLPIVYNTSGYERPETLRRLTGLVDVYLPDFKYMYSETAHAYSACADYPEVIQKALDEMFRQTGSAVFSPEGLMQKGLLVRHLVLPGHIKESKAILAYLYRTYKDDIYISIMSQYTPVEAVKEHPLLSRKLRQTEYEAVVDYALELGIQNAFIQE
ncbi:MAG: radical SAM protein, partial [Clostridia bacterium]|nr:radical SAM protein [Clostridia bacterium]